MIFPLGATSGLKLEKSRGVDGWTDPIEEEGSFFIDESHDMVITYDDQQETLTFGEAYDPYNDLDPKIREAVDRAPQWLNDTLVWSFTNINTNYRMNFAEVLLNESIDSRYMDEIAFTMAYMPSTFMNYYKIEGKYLWENAHMMYTVSDDVKYATISDYNLSDGQHSTITYKVPSGNVTMPEEIYYWYVVMPKIGHDNLEYMDPESGNFAYSYEGGEFWRTWLYFNNHTGYPLLKDYLADEDYLWNGKMNQIEDNGAVGAVTKWEMESVMFGMPHVRKINPIYVYMNHLGMCGENSYILAAVAKIALIPAVITVSWEGGHEWNDFWERGWHAWEGYSGQIDNPNVGGIYGSISAFTSVNPDFSHFSLVGGYTSTSNLTVRVRDLDGSPVDGVMVKLHSYPAQNVDGSLNLIANLTDVNGETTFEIGTGFNYFINYRAPIGGAPDQNAPAIIACTTVVPGADYFFNLTLPGRMPLKVNYSEPKESTYGVRFNISAEDIDHLTNFYEDDMNFNVKIWKGYEDITRLSVHFLDDENFLRYKNGQKFFAGGVMNLSEAGKGSIILDDQKWNILVSGKSAPLTRTFASLNISVSRSLVSPEAGIISPKEDSLFKVEEMINFEGSLDFMMDSFDDYSFKWLEGEGSSILSEERTFMMSFDEGDHSVDLEVWKDGKLVSSSSVSFSVYQPNRAPIVVIESPSHHAEIAYDDEVVFSANGSYDPDEESITFVWTDLDLDLKLSSQMEFSANFETGVHWVELVITDGMGLTAVDRVKFTVLDPVHPPVPMIISPSQGMTIFENERIELNATGTFDPDGDDLDYSWISSIDGVISIFMVDNVLLSTGEHSIELQVTDDTFSKSLFVNVTVTEEIELIDIEPVSIILSPTNRMKYYISDLIEFNAGSSYDPDGNTDLEIEWRVDGEYLSDEMVHYTKLPGGPHLIELFVRSHGLVSNSNITISVIDRMPIVNVYMNETAWFNGDAIDVSSFENITFDGSRCEDPDGCDLIYVWSINNTVVSNIPIFVHSFEPGSFLVELTVGDEGGNVNRFSLYITSKEALELPVDGSLAGDGGNEGKGVFQSLWLITPIIGLLIILGSFILLAIQYRRKRDDDKEKDLED